MLFVTCDEITGKLSIHFRSVGSLVRFISIDIFSFWKINEFRT